MLVACSLTPPPLAVSVCVVCVYLLCCTLRVCVWVCVYVSACAGAPGALQVFLDYDRAAKHGTGGVKVAGNYACDLLPASQMHAEGYTLGLYLDHNHEYVRWRAGGERHRKKDRWRCIDRLMG